MTTVLSQSCVATFMSFSFQRLLAALSVNPPWGVPLLCVCVCVIETQHRLWSFRFPAASDVWIEARCFEMLKSQPVHCQTVRHSQNSLTLSTHSLASSFFLVPLLSFYVVQMGASAVPPNRRSLQQHQVVFRRADRNVVWEDLLPITPKDSLFPNPPISSVVSPAFEPGCKNSKLLFCNNVDHPTLPKRTKPLGFK